MGPADPHLLGSHIAAVGVLVDSMQNGLWGVLENPQILGYLPIFRRAL